MDPILERLRGALADRYRVERELGQGGMATVYLAQDVRHDRPVALKVLHPDLAAVLGSDRFLAEIRTAAHLQNPHILPLFDSGTADGLVYYVMPFVDGESLRQRLTRERQLPVADAIRLTREVADALDAAHRQGVVHRDIKPENILLRDGRALVADFGIALAVSNAGGSRLTQTGLSLGTPQYMSPEQAAGERTIDGRSDVYSLGAVLYEMLGGEPPFHAATTQGVVAKLLSEEPRPLGTLRRSVPPDVEAAVHTALAKLPADRFPTAGAFAEALAAPSLTAGRTVPARRSPAWRSTIPLAAGLAALGVVAGRLTAPRPVSPSLPARLSLVIPSDHRVTLNPVRNVAIAPDGATVLYVGETTAGTRFYLRHLESADPAPLAGAEVGSFPLFSPDGRRVLFWVGGDLRVLPVGGGTPASFPVQPSSPFLDWSDAGELVWSGPGGLQRAPEGGGPVVTVVPPDSGGGTPRLQAVLPGGRTALAIAATSPGVPGPLVAVDLRSGRRSTVLEEPVLQAWHSRAGVLVFARPGGSLHAAAFDDRAVAVRGDALQLATGVAVTGQGIVQAAVAWNGTVVYVPQHPADLVLVDRSGAARVVSSAQRRFHHPRFSPDGRRIATDFFSAGTRDVWVLDTEQGTLSRATFEGNAHDAIWSRDGRSLLYMASRTGRLPVGVWRTRADGSAPPESLAAPLTNPGTWLGAGRALVAVGSDLGPDTGWDLARIDPDSGWAVRPYMVTPFAEAWPAISADGRWLAYASNETGRNEVYVRGVAGSTGRVTVSLDGGTEPVWAPDGRELFYRRARSDGSDLMSARFETAPGLRVVSRIRLFDNSEYDGAIPHANYDVHPNGGRFVMVRWARASEIVVLQHVDEMVRRGRTIQR